jgi:serine kinase of HPr protein (carbohydrate metabolism regulator)
MLDQQIRLFIAGTARDWIFVHAGAVAVDDRAIVLPGPSFSGKTSLVAALVQAGATYFSDEYAVVDSEGRVHPYPRPLSIRSPDGSRTRERLVGELGGVAADRAAEVALVASLHYRPGTEWNARRISGGKAMTALLSNTVPAQDRPKECLRALKNAVSRAIAVEGERGEADSAAKALLQELKQSVPSVR